MNPLPPKRGAVEAQTLAFATRFYAFAWSSNSRVIYRCFGVHYSLLLASPPTAWFKMNGFILKTFADKLFEYGKDKPASKV